MMYRADAAVVDPYLQGAFGISGTLQISGLSIALAEVGQPVVVQFTATNIGSAFGGEIFDSSDTITGAVVDANNVIVAKFQGQIVTLGPSGIQASDSAFVTLSTGATLPQKDAGVSLTAWVGPHALFDAFNIGDILATNPSEMLSAAFTVPGTAGGTTGGVTPSPQQGGSPFQGGSTPGVPGSNPLVFVEKYGLWIALGAAGLYLVPTFIEAGARATQAEADLKRARRRAA